MAFYCWTFSLNITFKVYVFSHIQMSKLNYISHFKNGFLLRLIYDVTVRHTYIHYWVQDISTSRSQISPPTYVFSRIDWSLAGGAFGHIPWLPTHFAMSFAQYGIDSLKKENLPFFFLLLPLPNAVCNGLFLLPSSVGSLCYRPTTTARTSFFFRG